MSTSFTPLGTAGDMQPVGSGAMQHPGFGSFLSSGPLLSPRGSPFRSGSGIFHSPSHSTFADAGQMLSPRPTFADSGQMLSPRQGASQDTNLVGGGQKLVSSVPAQDASKEVTLPPFFYEADTNDPMDVALLQELIALNLLVSARLNIKRLRPGEYEIESVRVSMYWQTAELFVRARRPRARKKRLSRSTDNGSVDEEEDRSREDSGSGEMPLSAYLRQLANVDARPREKDYVDAIAAAAAFAGVTGGAGLRGGRCNNPRTQSATSLAGAATPPLPVDFHAPQPSSPRPGAKAEMHPPVAASPPAPGVPPIPGIAPPASRGSSGLAGQALAALTPCGKASPAASPRFPAPPPMLPLAAAGVALQLGVASLAERLR